MHFDWAFAGFILGLVVASILAGAKTSIQTGDHSHLGYSKTAFVFACGIWWKLYLNNYATSDSLNSFHNRVAEFQKSIEEQGISHGSEFGLQIEMLSELPTNKTDQR